MEKLRGVDKFESRLCTYLFPPLSLSARSLLFETYIVFSFRGWLLSAAVSPAKFRKVKKENEGLKIYFRSMEYRRETI